MQTLSTREKIIEKSFSFYHDPLFEDVSLSDIAQKVGITKAAIFKHFKNKEALVASMNEKIFDEIANLVRSLIDEKKTLARNHALSEVIHFLLSHREYIMYFQSNP